MSSTNKTSTLSLNQWAGSDILLMKDFNSDKAVLDKEILLRNVLQGDITLYADQWTQAGDTSRGHKQGTQAGDKYRHGVSAAVDKGIRVDLSATVPNLLLVDAPLVAVNENGGVFVETSAPPRCNIAVQATLAYVLGGGVVVYGRALKNNLSGAIYPTGNVTGFQAQAEDGQIVLCWNDPEDDILDNVSLAVWAGTKIVRKVGGYPDTEADGVVVVDNNIRNRYQESGFADTDGKSGVTYYYQAFPYSTKGMVKRNVENRADSIRI